MLALVDTVPVSEYKAEVWWHLGFCGNVRPGRHLGSAASHVKSLRARRGRR